jgi:hypothetical protein
MLLITSCAKIREPVMKWTRLLAALAAVFLVRASPYAAGRPPLTVSGTKLVDATGKSVVLRGVSSMGMGMVYGDKARPGAYLPMSPAQYIDRAIQTDATGQKWFSTAIRLVFERYPALNPTRLYKTENSPYAMPDTVAFAAWQAAHTYEEGDVVSSAGKRFRVVKKLWRADRGSGWNPQPYRVGDIVVNVQGNVYRCTASTGTGDSAGNWGLYPTGSGTAITEDQGSLHYVWSYVGVFGLSGETAPSSLKPVLDNQQQWYVDNLTMWQYLSNDYTPAQSLKNFTDWKGKVLDPVVKRAIDDGLYVVICDFDFGPAHQPLRHARMLDFWMRMAHSQWANHPQVIFELWNESEDIGSYSGGPGSWVLQKPVIQETVDAIRAAGATNVVIVPTPFYSAWAGEATASPLTGNNLAYAVHQYRSTWEAYSSNREQINQALASGQAIVLTEWADDTAQTDPALQWPTATNVPPPLRPLIEPSEGSLHPVAGWFAWSLSQSWFPNLFVDADLRKPSPFGIATRRWLSDKQNETETTPSTAR